MALLAVTAAGRWGRWPLRGCPLWDLRVLKAPHFQELHLEVLLAERRVVEGLAALCVPPEQVGVKGQSLASPSTWKASRTVGICSPPLLPQQGHWPSPRGLLGLCPSLRFLCFGHSTELGWGRPELLSLLIGTSAWRPISRRAPCRAAGARGCPGSTS